MEFELLGWPNKWYNFQLAELFVELPRLFWFFTLLAVHILNEGLGYVLGLNVSYIRLIRYEVAKLTVLEISCYSYNSTESLPCITSFSECLQSFLFWFSWFLSLCYVAYLLYNTSQLLWKLIFGFGPHSCLFKSSLSAPSHQSVCLCAAAAAAAASPPHMNLPLWSLWFCASLLLVRLQISRALRCWDMMAQSGWIAWAWEQQTTKLSTVKQTHAPQADAVLRLLLGGVRVHAGIISSFMLNKQQQTQLSGLVFVTWSSVEVFSKKKISFTQRIVSEMPEFV